MYSTDYATYKTKQNIIILEGNMAQSMLFVVFDSYDADHSLLRNRCCAWLPFAAGFQQASSSADRHCVAYWRTRGHQQWQQQPAAAAGSEAKKQ
jgi:hypothetical protein